MSYEIDFEEEEDIHESEGWWDPGPNDRPLEFFEMPDELADEVLFSNEGEVHEGVDIKHEFIKWLEKEVGYDNFKCHWFQDFPIFFFKNPDDALKCQLRWL